MKDYLSKKEKVVGLVGTAIIGALLVFGLGPVLLPSIVSTLGLLNTAVSYSVGLAIKAALLVGVGFVVTNKRTWTLGWHVANMASRAISGLLIKIDPIGRLQAYADEYLASRREKIMRAIVTVTTVRKQNDARRTEYRKRINEARERANSLLKLSYDRHTGTWTNEDHQAEFRRVSMPIEMWEKTLEGFDRQEERLALQLKQLNKFRQGFDLHIDKIKVLVEDITTRYQSSQGMAEAASAISGSVGDGDMKRFFEQNVEYLQGSIAEWDAQVDVFLEEMPQFNRAYDVDNDIASNNLMDKLLAWDSKTDRSMERLERPVSSKEVPTLPHGVLPQQTPQSSRVRDLLG